MTQPAVQNSAPQPAQPGPAAPQRYLVPAALAVIVLLMMMRPGDASFVADEPRLISQAMTLNHQPSEFLGIHLPFSLARLGLEGSLKIRYGPMPLWIYQSLLLITHDLPTLVALRAAVVGGFTAVALAWLARTMRVTPWLAVVVMLSPWIWYFSRQLWDNSFCIPLCAIAFAAYSDFLATRCRRSLALAFACSIAALLVHLMATAIVLPLFLHAVIFERKALFKAKVPLLSIAIIFSVFAWPYLRYLFKDYHQSIEDGLSPINGWFFPLLGAHHLTAAGLGTFLGDAWLRQFPDPLPSILFFAQLATCAAYVAVWIGMLMAIPRAWRTIRNPQNASPIDHLCAVALSIFLCQSLLDGLQRAYKWDHYFNATWIAYVFFAWLATDCLHNRLGKKSPRFPIILATYATALLFVLSTVAFKIAHDHGGASRSPYGSSLAEQIAAAQKISQYDHNAKTDIKIPQWQTFPWALQFLCKQTTPPASPLPAQKLLVDYVDEFPGDARISVEVETP